MSPQDSLSYLHFSYPPSSRVLGQALRILSPSPAPNCHRCTGQQQGSTGSSDEVVTTASPQLLPGLLGSATVQTSKSETDGKQKSCHRWRCLHCVSSVSPLCLQSTVSMSGVSGLCPVSWSSQTIVIVTQSVAGDHRYKAE